MMPRAVIRLFALAIVAAPATAAAQQPPQQTTLQAPAISKDAPPNEPRLIVRWRDRYETLKDSGIAISAGSIVSGSAVSGGIILGKRRTVGIFGAVVEA